MIFSYIYIGDKMLNNLRNFINDDAWRINIMENKIDIVNYIDVLSLDDNRISIKYSNGSIIIKGNNLSISKMLDKELLIVGEVQSIEFA